MDPVSPPLRFEDDTLQDDVLWEFGVVVGVSPAEGVAGDPWGSREGEASPFSL